MLNFLKGHKTEGYLLKAFPMPKCLSPQRGINWSTFHKILPKLDQVIFTSVPNSLQNFKSLAQAVPKIFCLQAFPMPPCLSPQRGIINFGPFFL